MLNDESDMYFSVPVSNGKSALNGGKISRSITRGGYQKQGLLETWIEEGKKKPFCVRAEITPERADALLQLNMGNRNLQETTVNQYVEIMAARKWDSITQAIAIDRNGILINGQHRLYAVKKYGSAVEFTIWFGIPPKEAEVIDQGRKRGAKDIVQINGHPDHDIRAPMAKLLLILEKGDGQYRPPAQFVANKVQDLDKDIDRAVFWGSKMRRGKITKIRITTATAAAVAYYVIQKAGAPIGVLDKFFLILFQGYDSEGITPSVIAHLRDTLKDGDLSRRHDVDGNIKRAAAIIQGWNLYRKGRNPRSPKFIWDSISRLPPVVI